MSFYVTVVNAESEELSWLCGWQWYDLGHVMKDYSTIKDFQPLFDVMNVMLSDKGFSEVVRWAEIDLDAAETAWDYFTGAENIEPIDLAKYKNLDEKLVTTLYKAELEHRDKMIYERYQRRLHARDIIAVALDELDEYVRDLITECDFVKFILFLRKLRVYNDDVVIKVELG